MQLFAAVLAIHHWGAELAGKRVSMFIDSECVLDALVKGQSQQEDMLVLLKVFWDIVAEHQINLYLDKVSTDSNPSDGMSRDGEQQAEDMGWDIEDATFPSIICA